LTWRDRSGHAVQATDAAFRAVIVGVALEAGIFVGSGLSATVETGNDHINRLIDRGIEGMFSGGAPASTRRPIYDLVGPLAPVINCAQEDLP
jgi:hypothetical protein